MFRKRLVSLLSSVLLALAATPFSASAVEQADVEMPVIEVVTFAEQAAREPGMLASAVKAAAATRAAQAGDPTVLVDQEQEGVGRVYVAVDQEEMTLTIGVGIDPAGVDEEVTVGAPGSGGGDEDPADEAPADQASPEDVAASEDKAAMDQAKADAAAAAAAERDATPAFETGPRTASGTVASGTGTGRSVLPDVAAPSPDADTAADVLIDESNGMLRIFGALLLAGTSTVWGWARRNDLA